MDYEITCHTDIGTTRKVNQDSAAAAVADTSEGPVCMALLCDGMGGIAMGEYASSYVATDMLRWFMEELPELLRGRRTLEQIGEIWTEMLVGYDRYLREYGHRRGIKLGTTATCVLFWKGYFLLAQSGDSRLYESGRKLRQISRDQSRVQEQIDRGLLTKEEARRHPGRNILSDCIGGSRPSVPVCTYGRIRRGTNYVLCSDGLVHELSDKEIARFTNGISHGLRNDLQDRLSEMTEVVKSRGETDNITVVGVMVRGASSIGESILSGICGQGQSQEASRRWLFRVREKILLTSGTGKLAGETLVTETEGEAQDNGQGMDGQRDCGRGFG